MAFVLGVDPGLSGGLAVLDDAGAVALLHVMPVKDGQVDAAGLAALLWLHWPGIDLAAVENVHAMPGQGVTSMFCFGRGLGTILGVLGAMGVKVVQPSPQRWKKDVLADRFDHSTKEGTMAWAAQRFPGAQLVLPRCRKAHSGLCDALALAAWALDQG
jgi:crossover junction endodeoxyribonuclease RuvC